MLSFRAIFCRNAITLALNIKKHFDRFTIVNNRRLARIVLDPLPHPLPSHMMTVRNITYLSNLDDVEISSINEGHFDEPRAADPLRCISPVDSNLGKRVYDDHLESASPEMVNIVEERQLRHRKVRIIESPIVIETPRSSRGRKNSHQNLHGKHDNFCSTFLPISPSNHLILNDAPETPTRMAKKAESKPIKRRSLPSFRRDTIGMKSCNPIGRPRKNRDEECNTPLLREELSPTIITPQSLIFDGTDGQEFGHEQHDLLNLLSDMEVTSENGQFDSSYYDDSLDVEHSVNPIVDFDCPNKFDDTLLSQQFDWKPPFFNSPRYDNGSMIDVMNHGNEGLTHLPFTGHPIPNVSTLPPYSSLEELLQGKISSFDPYIITKKKN